MDIAALKEAINLHDLFEKLGLEKGKSGNYHAPWRDDERPSISVYDKGRKWKDHGDPNKSGSAIDIVMMVKELDVPGAMRFLHDLYGFPTSVTIPPDPAAQSQPKAAYLWQVMAHHKNRQKAVDYLVDERKLPRDFVEKLAGKVFGFSDYRPPNNQTDPTHGPAVVFPCGLPGQPPVVLNLRYIESEHDPKMRDIGGNATGALFAAPDWSRVKKSPIVWWVESPIDAITLAAAGCPAVSFLSASNIDSVPLGWMRPEQILRIWPDKDKAGQVAARKLYHHAIDAGLTPQCVNIEKFKWKDPNDGLKNGLTIDEIKEIAFNPSATLFPVGHVYLPEYEFHAQSAVCAYLDHMEITSSKQEDGDERVKISQISGFRVYRLDSLRLHDPSSVFGIQDILVSPEVRSLVHYRRVDSTVMQTAVIFGTDLGKITAWQNLGWIHSQVHLMRLTQILARNTHSVNDIVQVVGLVRMNDEYFLQDGPTTYLKDKECIYHDLYIPSAPQEAAKQIVVNLDLMFNQHLAVIIFAWVVGSLLKVFLGYWPHILIPAPSQSGKTTFLGILRKLTGATITEHSELETGWRRMRLVGNHTYPVFVDESSRASPEAMKSFINLLNSSYGAVMRHHGYEGKYLLSAPVALVGQDVPDYDSALLSKVIIVDIDNVKGELREFNHRFPVREFGEWLIARFTPKIALEKVKDNANTLFSGANNTGRFADNYGAMMVVLEELAEFSGLSDRFSSWASSLHELAMSHLNDTAISRRESVEILNTLARQIVLDSRGCPPFKMDGDSLIIHKSSILHYLKAKGYTFAITSTKRFLDHLKRDGFLISADVSRSIKGVGYPHCIELSLKAMDKASIDWPITETNF